MSEQHGSCLCNFCYESPDEVPAGDYAHRRIGKLFYYRSEEAQVRLDLIPARAWAEGIEWFIGNFIESEKIPVPPYIEGDIYATTEDRGDPVVVGHVSTRERESDGAVQYYMHLKGLPVKEWKRVLLSDKEHKSINMRVRI